MGHLLHVQVPRRPGQRGQVHRRVVQRLPRQAARSAPVRPDHWSRPICRLPSRPRPGQSRRQQRPAVHPGGLLPDRHGPGRQPRGHRPRQRVLRRRRRPHLDRRQLERQLLRLRPPGVRGEEPAAEPVRSRDVPGPGHQDERHGRQGRRQHLSADSNGAGRCGRCRTNASKLPRAPRPISSGPGHPPRDRAR